MFIAVRLGRMPWRLGLAAGLVLGGLIGCAQPQAAETTAALALPEQPLSGVMSVPTAAARAGGPASAPAATSKSPEPSTAVLSMRDAGTASQPAMADHSDPRHANISDIDAGAELPIEPAAQGQPLAAPSGTWTYVEFPDTRCRDGSPAGISVRLEPNSHNVLMYLEGGVYCFDETTCALNPPNVDDVLFNSAKREPTTGIFDRQNPENPVRDWNIVYVPYCTGDAMAGAKSAPTDVPSGPKSQWFVGRANLRAFLTRIVPTFPDATAVLLTGMSAGGSSVLASMGSVASAFAPIPVRFINDSSLPPGSGEVLPACLQKKMRELWGLDDTLLAECGDDCPDRDDFWRDYTRYVTKTFADRPNGYISAVEDEMMRMVAGLGRRDCQGSLLFDGVAAETYRAAMLDYRASVTAYSSYSTFYPDDTRHTWLKDASFYTGRAGTTRLSEWFSRIASGEVAGHAGP